MNIPDHEGPHQGAVGRPKPAEGDAGEHQQQQAEAHLELDLLGAEEHAAEAGQGAAQAQTKRMTRSTSMPDEAARSGLSATARIALPILVNCSSEATATITRR